ncbi:MAG: hypothetical protein Q9183_005720, partial [Haloplaca sp. 2 TL-2023]
VDVRSWSSLVGKGGQAVAPKTRRQAAKVSRKGIPHAGLSQELVVDQAQVDSGKPASTKTRSNLILLPCRTRIGHLTFEIIFQTSLELISSLHSDQMLYRHSFRFLRRLSTMSSTPVEDAMRLKITQSLSPTHFEVHNDSALHAHHKAMQGSVSKETHFRLVITSDAFKSKMQPARHRMVYTLLKEELEREGGIHALQLKTRTPEEEERQVAREQAEKGQTIGEVEKA